ncbi:NAD(P)-dependent oxidoreductase [Nonomuraea sp. NPDC048826]|uniref:NAD(P)-dependent oxidoreductase n=1 Tax=Nonomuraea sp. NPDC048826 TaxID=3364347 RepID=UPI003713B322
MNITVFGSTGRTGRHILAEAPGRGHRVTAFTRRPGNLAGIPDAARVVHGDGRDAVAVAEAVAGADAVIAIVAAETRKGPHHTAAVTRMITNAMAQAGVRRFVTTSAYPIVADKPRIPMAVLRWALADAYADQAEMERVVTACDLDWTIARLNRLLDRPAAGRVLISRDLLDRPRPLSRADAAVTLLDLAGSDTYAKAAVNVGGA